MFLYTHLLKDGARTKVRWWYFLFPPSLRVSRHTMETYLCWNGMKQWILHNMWPLKKDSAFKTRLPPIPTRKANTFHQPTLIWLCTPVKLLPPVLLWVHLTLPPWTNSISVSTVLTSNTHYPVFSMARSDDLITVCSSNSSSAKPLIPVVFALLNSKS